VLGGGGFEAINVILVADLPLFLVKGKTFQ
jgi:hypothetical protein